MNTLSKGSRRLFLIYLALLSIIGFLATDMYLPAFDAMRQDLKTSKAYIGSSLTIFLGGFAFAQILWGPIADKYGKNKAIIWGLSVFTLASLGIFLTHNIFVLLGLRLIQAIGGCAAAVSWQALVIDRFPESEAQKIFASIMPLVALSPALAPLLGAYISTAWGWRYIFLVIVFIAMVLIIYSFFLKEKPKQKLSLSLPNISYFKIFKNKKFIGNVMIYGFCSAGFFAWLTGAPFFLTELGYKESEIGLSFVPQTIAFIIGGYGYRLVAGKVDGKKVLPYLLLIYAIFLMLLFMISVFTTPTLVKLLIPFCFMAFANGATYPIVVAEALKLFPEHSGKASALQNTIQLSICFLASAGVSVFSSNALIATTTIMAATTLFVAWGYQLSKSK